MRVSAERGEGREGGWKGRWEEVGKAGGKEEIPACFTANKHALVWAVSLALRSSEH